MGTGRVSSRTAHEANKRGVSGSRRLPFGVAGGQLVEVVGDAD